ncbi:50S ribosomal protein L11 [Brachyspira catarrhinii]|uniref:Large ribosomal subunit protein uL11 n=1 Tax=Brachyspira catarrhinii TaxID=2528966 RepID=A0ABY2TMB9_9SPIR|nr:50S ribosomal protein L11 [Brachyspira catarrhinii]TKZ25486.1 50S ribosomal protein L11 [Brachyspira catarrhinii]
MAKKIVGIVKVRISGGEATPAPPLGPALGQKQIQIAAFVKDFNAKTSKQKGQLLNTYITVYEDKTYTFVTKGTSTSTLIKKKLGIEKGSGEPNKTKVASINQKQLEEIAQEKMTYMSANDIEAAKKIVAGTARAMGIKVE